MPLVLFCMNYIKRIVVVFDVIFIMLLLTFVIKYISFNKNIKKLNLVDCELIIREAELSNGTRMYKYTDSNWKDYYIIASRVEDGTIYVTSNRCRLHDEDVLGFFVIEDGVLRCKKSKNVIAVGQIGQEEGCTPVSLPYNYEEEVIRLDMNDLISR